MVDPEPAGWEVSMCFGCYFVVGQKDRAREEDGEGRSHGYERSVYKTWEEECTKAYSLRTKSLLMKDRVLGTIS